MRIENLTSARVKLAAIAVIGAMSLGALSGAATYAAEGTGDPTPRASHMDRCAKMEARLERMDKKLTPDQVKDIVAGRLAQSGENTLKVGKVSPAAGGIVKVDIVTTAGSSLVTTHEISTRSGRSAVFEKMCAARAGGTDVRAAGKGDGKGHAMRGDRHHGGFGHGGGFGFTLATLAPPVGENGRDLNLSKDDVKKLADAALILTGNPRLKVGAVKEKDANTFTVDIVTHDNALVLRRDVSKQTGRAHRSI